MHAGREKQMKTMTIDSTAGTMRQFIRNAIFDLGLDAREDKGVFVSSFRVRGEMYAVDELTKRIRRGREILERQAVQERERLDRDETMSLARRAYRRDQRFLALRNLFGRGAIRDELTRMECTTIHAELAILDARGDADARRRLDLSITEMGRLLYDHDAHDDTVSIMVKLHLAAIRTDVRAGRLAIAPTMAAIEKIVGRRRLPSLA